MSSDVVYTDTAFEEARSRHNRYTVYAGMWMTALNCLWWVGFAWSYKAWPMVGVDIFGAVGALLIIIAMRCKLLSNNEAVHIGMAFAFTFIWLFIIVVEGIPGDRFPTINHWWFITIGTSACLLFARSARARTVYAVLAVWSFIVCDRALFSLPALGPLPPDGAAAMLPNMEAGNHLGVFVMVILLAGVFVASLASADEQLQKANDTLESLLSNMLPKKIADRLREEGRTFADGFAECTVLFVDLVGFTKIAKQIPPRELVSLLDTIFSRFDELTEEAGLEKIKTIGDAYMVAAGLPEPRADHASACVALAFKMREVIREYADLRVRIGINSGAVVAGIIGKRRFIYDLWGDTVNIASRMESQGVVDEIQVSAATAELIKQVWQLQERGEIEVKGQGKTTVFLVVGRRMLGVSEGPSLPRKNFT